MAQTLPATISGAGRKGGEPEGGEGSCDSEQVAVFQWNVIIFRMRVPGNCT